jgi:hypothetical protein
VGGMALACTQGNCWQQMVALLLGETAWRQILLLNVFAGSDGSPIVLQCCVQVQPLTLLLSPPAASPATCAGMCLTTVVSYLSHSQVWAAQAPNGSVVLGGRTNRAKFGFQQELQQVMDAVPEVPPSEEALPTAPQLK